MRNVNILVFPCGSEIGLEIHRSLSFSKFITLYGASSVASNHGKFVFENYIEDVPDVSDNDFIEKLNVIINSYDIDYVIPAHDSVVLELATHHEEVACEVIGSPYRTCEITRSKRKTYEHLMNKVNVPYVYASGNEIIEYPVFLKPDIGQGSKGTYLAKNKEDVEFYLKKDPTVMILEYLPGDEYTIDCFTDSSGTLKFVGARQRARVSNGISVNSIAVGNEEFTIIANVINTTMKFKGMWFFQLKRNKAGELSLLEISARVSGTMGFYRNMGVNLPLLSVFDLMGYEIEVNKNSYQLEMDRALQSKFKLDISYENVYIDFDDTLVFKEKVNHFLVAFIYQSINHGKKIHLITRHKGDIHQTLEKYRLNGLFDDVIHLKVNEPKSQSITHVNSILIDDSFAERNEVHINAGIPTFDLDAVEALLSFKR